VPGSLAVTANRMVAIRAAARSQRLRRQHDPGHAAAAATGARGMGTRPNANARRSPTRESGIAYASNARMALTGMKELASLGLVGITLPPPGQGADGRHQDGQAGRFMDHESRSEER